MTLPVAFHLGYHKTGTSWLQREIFPRHPALRPVVRASPRANPFLVEVVVRPDREFDAGRARAHLEAEVAQLDLPDGGVAVVSAERLSGLAATGGYDTFRIAARLHAAVPEARVVFCVREQVAMIESEYRQLVLEGCPARLTDLVARTPGWRTVGFDLGHYEYDRLADRYVELFGGDRVRVFGFEAMVADRAGFLAALADHLGVPPWPDLPREVLERRVNAGLPKRLLGLRRFLNHFERSDLNPDPLLALPPVWRSPLAALASRLPARRGPLLDAATRARLQEHYRGANARLAQRHGVVLGASAA